MLMWLVACAAEPGVVATIDGWVVADEDPFNDVVDGDCDERGIAVEGAGVEVQTDVCPYVTMRQPALLAVPKGSVVTADLWYLDLWAVDPSQGHAAIQVGESVDEIRPDIPGAADAHTFQLTTTSRIHEGDDVYFHVHNHGANSWYLGEMSWK
jgi:hypothetical protein